MFTPESSCRSVELHGPRPAPLLLQKASHAIKKSPPKKPVVIHMLSPKVIHVAPSEFMSLVQQLTGPAAGSSSSSSPPATATLRVDERSGSGRRGSAAIAEGIRAPDPQRVPSSFQSSQGRTRPSDQSASWYDFFMGPSSAGGVSSSVLPSPGPYVDMSCRVARKT